MRISLTSDFPYQLLFFIAVGISYINNYELSLAVWLLVAGITVKRYYSKDILIFISFFGVIFLLGLLRTIFYDHDHYNIIRDIAYFIKPMVGILIGYQCFRSGTNNFFRTVVYIALFSAIIHLILITHAVLFEFVRTVHQIRAFGGYHSDFETFALLILIFHKKFGLNFGRQFYWILLMVIGSSFILYFARTNIIQLILLTAGMLGLYRLSQNRILMLAGIFVIGFAAFKWIEDMNPRRSVPGIEGFLYKVVNAPKEIYDPYVVNDNTPRFHDNFRSFETKVTVRQMMSREDLGLLLGNGFGATVNYGSLMATTEGSFVRHAPILHNGYTTVFLKTGLVGLMIFICSMLWLCFYGNRYGNNYRDNIILLINSTGIFMFISTLVFLGFYLKLDNKSLFIGGLIAYYEIQKRKSLKELS